MVKNRRLRKPKKPLPARLFVRLDAKSKNQLKRAADLRGVTLSDYVRMVVVARARREVE